jgi:hypothetical protein
LKIRYKFNVKNIALIIAPVTILFFTLSIKPIEEEKTKKKDEREEPQPHKAAAIMQRKIVT